MKIQLNRTLLPPQFILNYLKQLSRDDISTLIRNSPKKTCAFDHLPTWLNVGLWCSG